MSREGRDGYLKQHLFDAIAMAPDAIVVGDVSAAGIAHVAVRAVQAGILVVGSMKATSAGSALNALLDEGVSRHALAASVRSVLFQGLVRSLCANCNGGRSSPRRACHACHGVGFAGRALVSGHHALRGERDLVGCMGLAVDDARVEVPIIADAMRLMTEGTTTSDELLRLFGSDATHAFERDGIDAGRFSLGA